MHVPRTAITHDTYLKLRQTRRKVLPTAEDHRLYEFYGRAENSKHPNERTNSASYVNWSNEVQVQPSSSVHGRGDTILLRQ